MILAQIPFQETEIPSHICDPNRAAASTFSFTQPQGTVYLYVPPVIHDAAIRNIVLAGRRLYDAYAETVGVDKLPDFAMRPCVKTAMLDKSFYVTTMAKRTCDQYWRCFQEYTGAFQKYPQKNVLDRRMQIGPDAFAPSLTEEKCIRETYTTIRSLRDAYNHCGCADIFPTWPGALDYISISIAANPTRNLYYALKAHYREYIMSLPGSPTVTTPPVVTTPPPVVTTLPPVVTTIPVSPLTVIPEEPEPLDPDYEALMAQLEELRKSKSQTTTLLLIGGAVVLGMMVLGRK